MADNTINDPINEVPVRTPVTRRTIDRFDLSRVSWGAIWAGVMVTIGMEALFLSFGIFIAAAFSGSVPWSMAWYLVTMLVSFYIGAWCTARLADVPVRETSMLNGLATWGLATLGTVLVALVAVRWGAAYLVSPASIPTSTNGLWGDTEQLAGLIWGGVVLSLIAAYLGGTQGFRPQGSIAERETPVGPLRRAS